MLATKHGKGPVIATALARVGLHVQTVVCDTDALGTFSGEVERPGPPLETAVRKARLAMELTGEPVGLASEGAFGPDPALPLLTRNLELVVLVDDEAATTVVGRAVSHATRAFSTVVTPEADLPAALAAADLPRHAVIARPEHGPLHPVHKGLRTVAAVAASVAEIGARAPGGAVRLETDLRADRCPSRLEVIGAAAEDLAARLARHCPACAARGWGPEETLAGLPCGWCATPTSAARAEREACPACGHEQERPLEGVEVADPGGCPSCNP